jgi:iron-regulated transporter 1
LPSTGSRSPSPSTNPTSTKPLLYRLYTSHTLSTWNSRTFEFGAVIFLAAIFPGTLFFASCYALFRSLAAAVLGSWIGTLVDSRNRLDVVRQSIVWQRLSVAGSCLVLVAMLSNAAKEKGLLTYALFAASVVLACIEKLAYVANTVAVERDWIIVVSDSLKAERQDLNSVMRRIDLICKLIAPVGIGLLDGYSTKVAIWIVFAQNAISVAIEYRAIKHVYDAIPELGQGKGSGSETSQDRVTPLSTTTTSTAATSTPAKPNNSSSFLAPYKSYIQNPAFLASFALSLLYLTVLSFASQMTTYLLTMGFTSTHVSLMRLISVILELSATCAAPYLMSRIGAVRSGLWFINEQLISIALAIGLWFYYIDRPIIAGIVLVSGVAFSRLGLWGFDLSVQFLVQDAAPEAERGSFSAIEMSLQNVFELLSFATTMVWYRPEDFRVPIYISAGAIATSAACFAGFVRKRRGHLLHTDRCLKRCGKGKARYRVLPTIEEEVEMDEGPGSESRR